MTFGARPRLFSAPSGTDSGTERREGARMREVSLPGNKNLAAHSRVIRRGFTPLPRVTTASPCHKWHGIRHTRKQHPASASRRKPVGTKGYAPRTLRPREARTIATQGPKQFHGQRGAAVPRRRALPSRGPLLRGLLLLPEGSP